MCGAARSARSARKHQDVVICLFTYKIKSRDLMQLLEFDMSRRVSYAYL